MFYNGWQFNLGGEVKALLESGKRRWTGVFLKLCFEKTEGEEEEEAWRWELEILQAEMSSLAHCLS